MSQEQPVSSNAIVLKRITTVLKEQSVGPDIYHAAAWRLLQAGMEVECDLILLRAIAEFPGDRRFHAWLTGLAAARGNVGLTRSRLQVWLRNQPGDEPARAWLKQITTLSEPTVLETMPEPPTDAVARLAGMPAVTASAQSPMTHPLLQLSFASGNDLSSFSPTGLSDQEPIGAWAISEQTTLVLPSPRCASVELTVAVYPNVSPIGPSSQRFAVVANGQRIAQTRLISPGSVRVRLPDGLTTSGDAIHLIFEHPDGISPASQGVSGDVRKLSVMLEALALHQVAPAPATPVPVERSLYVCAIFKNEAKYLYEWLSYHDAVGVDHFFLYNNNSSDAYLDVLTSWPYRSKITLIDWPEVPGQTSAYRHMLDTHRDDPAWCAFIDLDEYLCPQSYQSVKQVLSALPDDCSGLYVHWLMFGSSGHKTQQPGRITERFVHRSYNSFDPNRIGKTIVRLEQATEVGFCHIIQSSGRMLNDSGDEIDQFGTGVHNRTSHNLIALNHYYTKSFAEWTARRSLGKADHPPGSPEFFRTEEEFHRHDQNVVEDTKARDLFAKFAQAYYPSLQE